MATRYLIDSNVVIGYLDGKIPLPGLKLVDEIIDTEINLSFITKIEVLRFNSSANVYKILEEFIAVGNVIGASDEIIDKTISICKATRIKLPDAIIAATALINNCTLITRNVSDFKNIRDLNILNPWEISA